jgi:hypothetical protein
MTFAPPPHAVGCAGDERTVTITAGRDVRNTDDVRVAGSRDGSIDVDSTAHDRSRWDPPELDR